MQVRRTVLFLATAVACAQDPRTAQEESVRRQLQSVEKQRETLRARVPAAPAATQNAFFTVPWTASAPSLAVASAEVAECEPTPPDQIGLIVDDIARREGLTPDLLRAVIEKESSYLPCAVSPKGAQGLMQLMPATASDLGVRDPFDPRQNVDAGARFLRQMLDRYGGNLVLALAAYNAGPSKVDALRGLPMIPETINYVSDILEKLRLTPEPVTRW